MLDIVLNTLDNNQIVTKVRVLDFITLINSFRLYFNVVDFITCHTIITLLLSLELHSTKYHISYRNQ